MSKFLSHHRGIEIQRRRTAKCWCALFLSHHRGIEIRLRCLHRFACLVFIAPSRNWNASSAITWWEDGIVFIAPSRNWNRSMPPVPRNNRQFLSHHRGIEMAFGNAAPNPATGFYRTIEELKYGSAQLRAAGRYQFLSHHRGIEIQLVAFFLCRYTKVFIAPSRNWNASIKTRSIKTHTSFYRTIEELKFVFDTESQDHFQFLSHHRGIEIEIRQEYFLDRRDVFIAPSRNWNFDNTLLNVDSGRVFIAPSRNWNW